MTDHRELVAYHEAGHAVACYALHRPFEYVTLVEDENGERLGHIPHPPSYRWYFDHFLNVDAAAWDSALHALAGPVAEYRRMGGDDEWGNIHEYLKTEQIPDDGPETDQHAAENYLMIHSRERNLYNLKGVRDSLLLSLFANRCCPGRSVLGCDHRRCRGPLGERDSVMH